jgi:hypothetical protein
LSTLPSSPTGDSFTIAEPETASTIADVPIPKWWQRERERADVEAAITETPLSGILLERESTTSIMSGHSRSEQGGAQPSDQVSRDRGVAAPPSTDLEKSPPSAEPSSTRALTSSQIAAYVARARRLLALGDIAGARLLLEPAAAQDDTNALFALAETYDALMLTRWRVIGLVQMTRWHECSMKGPLNGAMPKRPRVSRGNVDSSWHLPPRSLLGLLRSSGPPLRASSDLTRRRSMSFQIAPRSGGREG